MARGRGVFGIGLISSPMTLLLLHAYWQTPSTRSVNRPSPHPKHALPPLVYLFPNAMAKADFFLAKALLGLLGSCEMKDEPHPIWANFAFQQKSESAKGGRGKIAKGNGTAQFLARFNY